MKAEELALECEELEEFRAYFGDAIRVMVQNLMTRKLETGTVTAKLKIIMTEDHDEYGEVIRKMDIEPDISMKIGAHGKMKCKKRGVMLKCADDGALIIGERQMDIDELIRERAYENHMSA